ncbi:MAG: aminotransferase class V-fold PLP-dependent enzyme, partial [Pseudomonadota bacterium]
MKIGYNGLFIPGPTNIPNQIRQAMSVPLEDIRAPDFADLTLPLFADLKKIFKTKNGQIFIFPSSGTGGWEAALQNTLSPGDKILSSSFGRFSVLWCRMCKDLGFDNTVIDVEWGRGVPIHEYERVLKNDKDKQIKAVLVCHNETTTGVKSDIGEVRRLLDQLDHPAMLYVDGISSIGSIEFDMDADGIDLAIAGSQKGFMMPTGLSIIAVSKKALEAIKTAKSSCSYFCFNDMINANKTGYFPYTPATTLLRGLRAAVDLLLEEGLENVFKRHHKLASGVRAAVKAWGMELCAQKPKWYSDTVSTIVMPQQYDANKVISNAYYRYHLSLGLGL